MLVSINEVNFHILKGSKCLKSKILFGFNSLTVFMWENHQNCKIDVRFLQYFLYSSSLLRSFHYFPGAEILHGHLYNMYLQYSKSFSCINWYFGHNVQNNSEGIWRKIKMICFLISPYLTKYRFIQEKLWKYWRYILFKSPCKISAPGK